MMGYTDAGKGRPSAPEADMPMVCSGWKADRSADTPWVSLGGFDLSNDPIANLFQGDRGDGFFNLPVLIDGTSLRRLE